MDKIRGWEDEEKSVGSKFATCMWIYTKNALSRTNTKSSNGGVFEEATIVHYAEHELGLCWNIRRSRMVSENTISQHEEEILGVQWSLLWFSAPSRLSKISGFELKLKKYDEVVNIAIMDAIVRPF